MKVRRHISCLLILISVIAGVSSCGNIGEKPKKSFQTLLTNDSLKYWERSRKHQGIVYTRGWVYDSKRHIVAGYSWVNGKRCTPSYIINSLQKRFIKGYLKTDRFYQNKLGDSIYDFYEKSYEKDKIIRITEDSLIQFISADGHGEMDTALASKDQATRIIVTDTSGKEILDYTHIIPFDSIK